MIARPIPHRYRVAISIWWRRIVLWSGGILVGSLAVAFALGADAGNHFFRDLARRWPWAPLILMPVAFAGLVWISRRFFPGAEGSGIPQAIAAIRVPDRETRDRLLSPKVVAAKMFLTVGGLFSGASIGREGPTVQVGAALMYAMSRFARFPRADVERGLILAGGAAGIAAAFNTPLAGIVFAVEELSRSFEERTSGTVLTAVFIAGVTAMAFLGNYAYFGHTGAVMQLGQAWVAVLICGLAGGLLGGLFSLFLIKGAQGLPGHLGEWQKDKIRFAAGCGFVLAILGLISGGATYGSGYEEAKLIIEGKSNGLHATFGFTKMAATVVSYWSGLPGGIFAPTLAAGAGLGHLMAEFMPYTPYGAVILLAMVAYFSGVVQAPITSFVIVMEMTDNQGIVLPLMAASLLGTAASRTLCHHPLYRTLAENFIPKPPQHPTTETEEATEETPAKTPVESEETTTASESPPAAGDPEDRQPAAETGESPAINAPR